MYLPRVTSVDLYFLWIQYFNRISVASTTYAQQCYKTNLTAQECSIFVKKELPSTVTKNERCPFPGSSKICVLDAENIRIDTANLNSHDDFGMNTEPKDRVEFRRVATCAPLRTDGYNGSAMAPEFGSTTNASEVPVTLLYYGDQTQDINYTMVYPTRRTATQKTSDYLR